MYGGKRNVLGDSNVKTTLMISSGRTWYGLI